MAVTEERVSPTGIPLHIPTLVIIGGPPLHAGYVRRLFKAETAEKITFDRIVVIDRDPACAVSELVGDRVRLEAAEWNDWLGQNLSRCGQEDHLVPYHWAPHVLLDWLSSDLASRGRSLHRTEDAQDPPAHPPVLRPTAAGDVAMSYAEWLCPPACIEPALCPHTRGPKSWSLATELAAASRSFVFPCTHLAFGVGSIPVSEIFSVRDRLLQGLERGEIDAETPVWIGSASHCHGLSAKVRF